MLLEGKFPCVTRSNYHLIALNSLLINELRRLSGGKLTRIITWSLMVMLEMAAESERTDGVTSKCQSSKLRVKNDMYTYLRV